MSRLSELALLALLVRTIVEGVRGILPVSALTEKRIKAMVIAVSAGFAWSSKLDILSILGFPTYGSDMAFALNTMVLAVSSMGCHDILDYLAGKR